MNLYPIMIRRHDFVRGERLLQAIPYLVLDPLWAKKLRKQSLALAERCAYYFVDSPAEYTIKRWQQKIINYCEKQERMPLPMFRLTNEWETFFEEKRRIRFQSARGEPFHLPLTLSEELAYLCGVIMRDGHLEGYIISIVDYSKEYIRQITQKMKKTFGGDVLQYPHTQCDAFLLCQKGKWLVRFIHFLTGQAINKKKNDTLQEPLLFKKYKPYRQAFWQGMMDTDGSYRGNITFCSREQNLIQAFGDFLKANEITFAVYENKATFGTSYAVTIRSEDRKAFSSLVGGTCHRQKNQELQELLAQTNELGRPTQRYLITSFREDRIIYDEQQQPFFDFSHLTTLQVIGLTSWLKKWRAKNDWTQKEIAQAVAISPSRLRTYEHGTAIPLSLLQQLLELDPSIPSFMPFLVKHKINQFRSRNSKATLPLKPGEKLEPLYQCMLVGKKLQGKRNHLRKIATTFSIPFKQSAITNSVLYQFLTTFMTLVKKKRKK